MESLAEREKKAHEVWQLWRRHSRTDDRHALSRAEKALIKLLQLCTPELESIYSGLGVDWRDIPPEWRKYIANSGIRVAAQTRDQQFGYREMLPYARECFGTAHGRLREELLEAIRRAPASEVLDKVLELRRQMAAAVLDTLTPQRRWEVGFLAGERSLGVRPGYVWISAPEPRNHLQWVCWYALNSAAGAVEWKEADAGAVFSAYIRRGHLREVNKDPNRCTPKDPESVSHLAQTFDIPRDRLRKYLKDSQTSDLSKIEYDGDGGVYYTINLPNTIRLLAEITKKGKPGPKKQDASE